MDCFRVERLFDLNHTIAAELFTGHERPWEVLPLLKDFILRLGETLDPGAYEQRGEGIWIAKTAQVFASAYIAGPAIIDEGAQVRHCAFLRGSVLVGKNCVVGNSTELKNALLFDGVQAPHYNYVGDSILGHKAHMGAGSITSNVKSDKTLVHVKAPGVDLATGLKKFGAMLGDGVEIGCNSVLNPGCVIGRGASVYPTACVRGYVPENHIYKDADRVVLRRTMA